MPRDAVPDRPTRRRALQVVAGLALGLALAEGGFYLRDGGAFPHLNVYRADAELGVRLEPGASQKVRFGGSPVTVARINAQGYRGEDWPSPSAEDVVVVGDSQVFGLGVEETETTPARLAKRLGGDRRVLNAGVPTYGPLEYNRVLQEVVAARKPKLVVWVVNVYNDFFEADRSNAERHTVWDGWAVRKETAPGGVTSFPGRGLLYRRSHAFYALRRLLHGGKSDPSLSLPSEGTWKDFLTVSSDIDRRRSRATDLSTRWATLRELRVDQARDALLIAQIDVESLARKHLSYSQTDEIHTARAQPGDIVDYSDGGESSRPGPATAAHIRAAIQLRERAEASLRETAEKFMKGDEAKAVFDTLDAERRYEERIETAAREARRIVRAMSPLARRIRDAKEACDGAGARLVVVGLPMDVQVSREEWAKYGAEPTDMEPTRVLLSDVVEAAEAVGATGLDATEALRAAQPGAFLPRDLHLTPKGHQALADAIAAAITMKPAPPLPVGGTPPGRSRVPTMAEWQSIGETLVYGSTARGCVTKRLREWIGIFCGDGDSYRSIGQPAVDVRLVKGGHAETLRARWEGPTFRWSDEAKKYEVVPDEKRSHTLLIAPVLPGEELLADFFWKDKKSRLVARMPPEGPIADPDLHFEAFEKQDTAPMEIDARANRVCDCHKQITGSPTCLFLPAQPDADCERTYAQDCSGLVACSSGDPAYPPACSAGMANGGSLARCYPLCGDGKSCKGDAKCATWQGGDLCMPPDAEPTRQAPPPPAQTDIFTADPPDEIATLAHAVVLASQELTRACKLTNHDSTMASDGYYYSDVYDQCPRDEARTRALAEAQKAFEAKLVATPAARQGPAALFAEQAALLREWAELGRGKNHARGVLMRFALCASTWSAWRPAEKVGAYSEELMKQYRDGKRTSPLAKSRPEPEWRRCRTGPCL